MPRSSRPHRPAGIGVALAAALALLVAAAAPAAADTIGAGEATAFGGTITLGGEEAVPPTPLATATLPGDASETLVDIPAEPLAVSGTLNADAAVHEESDIDSQLEVVTQEVAGPYNAAGVALIEGAEVLLDSVAEDVSLVAADVIRAEAVGVCTAGAVQYSANSEIISLQIGGEDVPLNEPITQILDGLNGGLTESGLNALVDIQRNVVTELEDGIAVDALVVTVLSAAGDAPLGEVRLGHAEVRGVTCGAAVPVEDAAPAPAPAPDVSPSAPAQLPATGGDAASTAGLAAAMAAGALAIVALRRRLS